jgi:glycosyltransferase involved in cell wall biosynthesis
MGRILLLDHGKVLGGGQVMAARLLPLLRRRFLIDAHAARPEIGGAPIPEGYRALRRAMRGYDLVYCNTPRTALAAATTSRPFLWHKHSPGTTWAQRIAARRARRVISVTRRGAPGGGNVRVIHNGVPDVTAPPAEGLPAGPRILILGRLHPEKGHDVAVEALARMRTRATLLVAGPGEWRLPRGDRVLLLGYRQDVPSLLAAADVLLMASRCDEGAPLAVLEAQMAGVPVVATRVGGIPEIVEEGVTAFLVPREDPAAMADALDRALAVDRARWKEAGRAHALRFTLASCAAGVASVIDECFGTWFVSAEFPAGKAPTERVSADPAPPGSARARAGAPADGSLGDGERA